MDDDKIYELLAELRDAFTESLTKLHIKLREVSTKLDERHALYEERHSLVETRDRRFAENIDTAFKRLRKLELDQIKTSVLTGLVSSVVTAVLTAFAVRWFVK